MVIIRGAKSVATWQPSCQKDFKNQALAESFWLLLRHFLTIKQFGGSIKEIIAVFLQNGHIFHPFISWYPKKAIQFSFMLYKGTFMLKKCVIFMDIYRHKVTFFMPDFCIFAESFRSNTQAARNSFHFLHLCGWGCWRNWE